MSNILQTSPLLPILDYDYDLVATFQFMRDEDIDVLLKKVDNLLVHALDFNLEPNEHEIAKYWAASSGVIVTYGMWCAMEWERRNDAPRHPVFTRMASLQYLVGHTRSSWVWPKWTLSQEYVAASRSLMIQVDPQHYREHFPEISHHHEVDMPITPMKWYTGTPDTVDEPSPFCQCQKGSSVTALDIDRDDELSWWVCLRCGQTIEHWISFNQSMMDQEHTFSGGDWHGFDMETRDLLDDQQTWSSYRFVEVVEGSMFSDNAKMLWEHDPEGTSTCIAKGQEAA